MAVNGFSVGKDVTIDLVTQGGPIALGLGTGFSSKQDVTETTVVGLDSRSYPIVQPKTWSGTLDYERGSGALDRYFSQSEAAYYAGSVNENIYLTQTVEEPDGSISQFQFTNCVLKYDDAGSWAGEGSVKQKVSWIAARRIQVT